MDIKSSKEMDDLNLKVFQLEECILYTLKMMNDCSDKTIFNHYLKVYKHIYSSKMNFPHKKYELEQEIYEK